MNHLRTIFVLATMICAPAGCGSELQTNQSPAPPSPELSGLPVNVTVKQRSTTVLPESNGTLRVTIDDITRGQVMTSLAAEDGTPVLAATSLAAGDTVPFRLGSESYQITLKELNNALVGEDFATFEISIPGESSAISEQARIERLLSAVEAAQGDVFIRNGTEHTAKEAADHLRTKWKAAGGNITTAEQFIDEIASKSSLSEEQYSIRHADGTEVAAADYLRNKLAQIEAGN